MTKLATRLFLAVLASAPAGVALAQSKLPLRDYGYDRRYEKDRTVRGGADYDRSGRSGLDADAARRGSDRSGGAARSDYMDLRTRSFDDRGASVGGGRPSVDGGRSRSFSD